MSVDAEAGPANGVEPARDTRQPFAVVPDVGDTGPIATKVRVKTKNLSAE